MINFNVGVEGHIRIKKFKTTPNGKLGKLVQDTGWFKNIITDTGLNLLASSNWFNGYCHLGSGTTPQAATDTTLETQIVQTNTKVSGANNDFNAGAPDYYLAKQNAWQFSQPPSNRNFTEVGFSQSGGNLCSRALIVDSLGNPTTITQLADEILQFYYEFRLYQNLSDVTGTLINQAAGGQSHDYVLRSALVSSSVSFAQFDYTGSQHNAFAGSLGSITNSPSGATDQNFSGKTTDAYVQDSFEIVHNRSFSLSEGNLAGGLIKSHRFVTGSLHWQCEFTPGIPKTSDGIVDLRYKVSWTRRP